MLEAIRIMYLDALREKKTFSRSDLFLAMREDGYALGESSFKSDLQKMLADGKIARAGRNAYFVLPDYLRRYQYQHSPKAMEIAKLMEEQHPYLSFTIFELVQMNEFVNHLIAHNTFFISVSRHVEKAVFETLQEAGQWTLLHPSQELYEQYWSDDMVIVNRLISEAPMGDRPKWSPCLEKILVDIVADKLIHDAIAESEFAGIYQTAFERYIIDESALFRYARRRNAEEKIRKLIADKTEIELRVKQYAESR